MRKIAGGPVLTDEKARQIEVLDVSQDNIQKVLGARDPITSLRGIQYLKYVKDLNCRGQELKTLNLELNSRVEKLDCSGNQLTDLGLDPRGSSLRYLDCGGNNLTALDLSSNVALEYLGVDDNPITELDLRAQSNLQQLSCSAMKLKKLDVGRCTELQKLYCNDNQIETLDLRSNKKLQALQCQNNRLSWLDLSSNTALDPTKVDCSGNVYDIKVDENLQYKVYPDLPCYGATEGTYFTAARASDWTGGTVSKVDAWDVLTLDNRDVEEVTYKYDTGNAKIGKVAFTLKTEVPPKYITISFDPNGGTGTMQPMKVKSGENFTLPECTFTPPEGKEFAGWLAANGTVYPAGDIAFSTTDTVLKATWKDKAEVDVTQMFTDVTKNWAYPGIQYCVTHQLMSGIGNDLFGPKLTTTRAQIVQILYNLEGEPKVSGTTPFTDLTQDWYQDAILWAYQTGVVAGTSSTTFEPDLPVTREQIAVILMEYMTRVLKLERTWTPADLSAFPDAGSVSDWAKDAMADAVGLGLISGASNGGQTYLEPQGSATREQVATILMEFCKNVKK